MPPPLSDRVPFAEADWAAVPDVPGAYVVYDRDEVVYVGMAGRNGKGSLRRRLKAHASGQIVNMFAQYLFLDRAQFVYEAEHGERVRHPRVAKQACRAYIDARCAFAWATAASGAEAQALETDLRRHLVPALNPL
ncbi:MAG: GIY-YIG nuclease family protein [Bacteroidota bacterium]